MDADAAGEEAMLRTVSYENMLNAEMRVIILPQGKDPDEVMREDMTKWQGFIDAALPLVDFLFERTVVKLDLSTARDKSAAVDRLLPVIAAINDPIRQAHYLQKLAALVKVDMNTIKASLSRLKPSPVKRLPLTPKPTAAKTSRPLVSHAREEYFLALLLKNPELKNMEEDLSVYIVNSENREIYSAWREVQDLESLT